MPIIKIFVGKNNFAEQGKNHPDIIISQMVETGELDAQQRPVNKFVKIGGAWKSKSGKPTYMGSINTDDIQKGGTTALPKKNEEITEEDFGPF